MSTVEKLYIEPASQQTVLHDDDDGYSHDDQDGDSNNGGCDDGIYVTVYRQNTSS